MGFQGAIIKVCFAIGALALGVCVGSSSHADVERSFQVAQDGTRTFSHCSATAKYDSEISVFLSINRAYAWSIAFANPQLRLGQGQQYDIAFSIDRSSPIYAKATAITTNMAQVPIADTSELLLRFRRGNMLQVTAANQVFNINLTGISALLTALLACVRQETTPVGTSPFTAQQAPRAQPSRESFQAEAAVTAANVLRAAGINKFSFGSLEDAAKLKADTVWSAGAVVGTIKIVENVKLDDPQIPSILIGEDARNCSKGAFLSGSLPDSDGKEMLQIFTSCQQERKNMTVYYLAVPRPKGGIYLFHHNVGWPAASGKGSRFRAAHRDLQSSPIEFITWGDTLSGERARCGDNCATTDFATRASIPTRWRDGERTRFVRDCGGLREVPTAAPTAPFEKPDGTESSVPPTICRARAGHQSTSTELTGGWGGCQSLGQMQKVTHGCPKPPSHSPPPPSVAEGRHRDAARGAKRFSVRKTITTTRGFRLLF